MQSEKEKQLLKQVRKEEKKLQKVAGKLDGLNDDDEDVFDPIELRLKRQEALTAMRAPIFPPPKKYYGNQIVRENFPFVFDSKLTTKSCAGT